ncbi:MAG: HAD-IIB family hydrolase [bacterium]|nr:HAD-IIB family hydrolase [bacterium]
MKKIYYLLLGLIIALSTQTNAQAVKQESIITYPNTVISSPYQNINNLIGNFNKPIKMIFTDIDGTLIPNAQEVNKVSISADLQNTLNSLRKKNIPLILTSSRPAREGISIARKLGLGNVFIIGDEGGEIVNPNGIILYEDGISPKLTKDILKNIKSFNSFYNRNVKCYISANGALYTLDNFQFPHITEPMKILTSTKDINKNFHTIKMVFYSENPKTVKLLRDELRKYYPKLNIYISNDNYCDISSPTASKAIALKKIADMYAINIENVAVFGDYENDINMLEYVKNNGGLSITFENTSEPVKRAAKFISTPTGKGGVKKAIEIILKNNEYLKED